MTTFRLRALPLLLLPGYMIFSSLQACSSSSQIGDTGDASSQLGPCNASETAKKVNGTDVCCTGAPGSTDLTCRGTNAPAPGQGCTNAGTTVDGTGYQIAFDVCVKESCTGDRTCEEFPQKATERTGTLVCQADSNGALVWQWQGDQAVHEVDRACLVTSVESCGSGGVYDDPTYAYTPRDTSYGYPYVCGGGGGGGYYYGGTTVRRRELLVLRSTCTTNGVASPCPTGDL